MDARCAREQSARTVDEVPPLIRSREASGPVGSVGRAMAIRGMLQPDLFEDALDPASREQEEARRILAWHSRLATAFEEATLGSRFLPLAEEAIAACPQSPEVLLLAATAALLDGRHERATQFL